MDYTFTVYGDTHTEIEDQAIAIATKFWGGDKPWKIRSISSHAILNQGGIIMIVEAEVWTEG